MIDGLGGNDRIEGRGGDDTLFGGTGNDDLYGQGGNDFLIGGSGADTMTGGEGDDTYVVDRAGDQVVELPGEGVDTIKTGIRYTLPDNVENLILTDIDGGKGVGNAQDNRLTGSEGNDTLQGEAGDDMLYGNEGNDNLDGETGADAMYGGSGDDKYSVDNAGDTVIESQDQGVDLIVSTVSYTLPGNVENLTLSGSEAINGNGNAFDNTIVGGAVANTLDGLEGNDTLKGGGSGDTLYGGAGRDALYGNGGNDVLDGGAGVDTMIGGAGSDTYYVSTPWDIVVEEANEGADSVIAAHSCVLPDNVENLTVTGTFGFNAYGNSRNNALNGNAGTNQLIGWLGKDTLDGGAGNDFLLGMDDNDTLSDSSGWNYFDGGAGNDKLMGGVSSDFFMGGTGDDHIDTGDGNDIIAFNRGDGSDTIMLGADAHATVSLGGGIAYEDMKLKKRGNDLVLMTGTDEGMTFKNWYAGDTNRNVFNLQVMAEAMSAFDANSSNQLLSRKVQNFDFKALTNAFDAARTSNSRLTTWAISDALAQFHLSSSDSEALGADLSYQYGKNQTLTGIAVASVSEIMDGAGFGRQAQALKPLSGLQQGDTRIGMVENLYAE